MSSGLTMVLLTHGEEFLGTLAAVGDTDPAVLRGALNGSVVGAFEITEDSVGSDVSRVETVLEPEGEGYRLPGAKRYVSAAISATHLAVLARDLSVRSAANLTVVLVDRVAPGVDVRGAYPSAGLAACDVARVELDTVVGADRRLGSAGLGAGYVNEALLLVRLGIACLSLHAARDALGLAVAYGRARHIGGGRIVDQRAVRHRLAAHAARVWAAEALLDVNVAEMAAGQRVDNRLAAAKLTAVDTALAVFDDAMQVFGGRGYTTDFPFEAWWRDVRVGRIGGGTDDEMREVIARSLDRCAPRYDDSIDELVASDEPVEGT